MRSKEIILAMPKRGGCFSLAVTLLLSQGAALAASEPVSREVEPLQAQAQSLFPPEKKAEVSKSSASSKTKSAPVPKLPAGSPNVRAGLAKEKEFPPVAPNLTRVERPSAVSGTRVERPSAPGQSSPAPFSSPSSPFSSPAGNLRQPVNPPHSPLVAGGNGKEQYPAIGNLENLTFGKALPQLPIEVRLSELEKAIFKNTFAGESLFDRTERLKHTILGSDADTVDPNSALGQEEARSNPGDWIENPHPSLEDSSPAHYLDAICAKPENNVPVSKEQASEFFIALVNDERRNSGLPPLSVEPVVQQLAAEHVAELAGRNCLSHYDSKGNNPDRRLTLLGCPDAVSESVTSLAQTEVGGSRLTRASMAKILKVFLSRQDDRDAFLSADSSHLGFACDFCADKTKVVAVLEVLTRRGLLLPIPKDAIVGEKIELKGVVQSPYNFERITVAWEAANDAGNAVSDDGEEALAYFPPLDYVAYGARAERDNSKAILALKTVGVVAAVAGGLFVPPVAFLAPIIAVAGSSGGDARPISDIPVKGGIKVDGGEFSGKIVLSNQNKPGFYYVTVWASVAKGQKVVPISRRVVLAEEKPQEDKEPKTEKTEKNEKGDKIDSAG
jgi:hypothetical protein